MDKTFAKTSVEFVNDDFCNEIKTCPILHLEAKYAKMDCKNEIYAKNWVRST